MTDRVLHSLECYLDLLATKQKLVASNIANLDTPGYRSRDIDFQGELQAALARPTRDVIAQYQNQLGTLSARPMVEEVHGLQVKNDGNNVNLDREARLLGENSMRFEMASTMLASRFRMMRLAIKEGNLG